jgi:hypothetical protein
VAAIAIPTLLRKGRDVPFPSRPTVAFALPVYIEDLNSLPWEPLKNLSTRIARKLNKAKALRVPIP